MQTDYRKTIDEGSKKEMARYVPSVLVMAQIRGTD